MWVENRLAAQRCHKLAPSDGGPLPSLGLFDELMRGWSGLALRGVMGDFDEPERSPRLLSPKSYVYY